MNQLSTVALPDNLYWSDEFDWSPVRQARTYTLTGAMIAEESTALAGRPITLEGAWVPRTTVQALVVLEAQEATPMTLTLSDGRTFQVLFRREQDQALEVEPLFPRAPASYTNDTIYTMTLRLMEI